MEILHTFLAKHDIKSIKQQIELTLIDLKQKAPDKKNYINSMSEAVGKLDNILVTFEALQDELRIEQRRNSDLEMINLRYIAKIKELQNNAKV